VESFDPDERLLERILSKENRAVAWKRVKANRGAPGVDGIAVDMDLSKFFDTVNHDVLMRRVARKVRDKAEKAFAHVLLNKVALGKNQGA